MEVLRNGRFMFTIGADELSRGIRPSKRAARNEKYLVQSISAVGLDGVLQVIDDLEANRVDTTLDITDGFPYPQIFVFKEVILFCGEADIYEYVTGVLTHRLGPVTVGTLWSAIEYHNFIYMSNGVVAVIRDPNSGIFAVTALQPAAYAMCDFNGQVMLGGPEGV